MWLWRLTFAWAPLSASVLPNEGWRNFLNVASQQKKNTFSIKEAIALVSRVSLIPLQLSLQAVPIFFFFSSLFCSFRSIFLSFFGGYPTIPTETFPILTHRVGFSAVVVNEYLFVFGGFYHPNQGGNAAETVEIYSALDGTPRSNSSFPMITPRGFMTTILVNDSILYAIGGSETFSPTKSLAIIELLQLDLSPV
jgi:hypothetical protein